MERGKKKKKTELFAKHLLRSWISKYSILKFILCQGEHQMAKGSSDHFKTKGKYRKEY